MNLPSISRPGKSVPLIGCGPAAAASSASGTASRRDAPSTQFVDYWGGGGGLGVKPHEMSRLGCRSVSRYVVTGSLTQAEGVCM